MSAPFSRPRPRRVVILAGGLGTRLAEETIVKPKPMVEIGGRPIIWHIMRIYAHFGLTEFIVCAGYRGDVLKEYFGNYHLHTSDVTFDLRRNTMEIHRVAAEPWRVTVVDTGVETMTVGRLRRIQEYLQGEDFCLTYGDGVANIDIDALIAHHYRAGRLATITAVRPPARFGAIEADGDRVIRFQEKPRGDGGWINGGFFVMNSGVLDYTRDDSTSLELECLMALAQDGQLTAYYHNKFWQAMDTLRDLRQLEKLWATKQAPWKVW
jgi:glucose-1-phosphate cytidylyltransferase